MGAESITATVSCRECGRKLRVPEEKLGKTFFCPGCQAPVRTRKPVEPAASLREAGPPRAVRILIFSSIGAVLAVATAITVFVLTRSSDSTKSKERDSENLASGELVGEANPAPFAQPEPQQPVAGQPFARQPRPNRRRDPFAQPPDNRPVELPRRNPVAAAPTNRPPGRAVTIKDLKIWELADFKKALDERNPAFIVAVGLFGQRKAGDDQIADELAAILAAAGNLPDERYPGASIPRRTTPSRFTPRTRRRR